MHARIRAWACVDLRSLAAESMQLYAKLRAYTYASIRRIYVRARTQCECGIILICNHKMAPLNCRTLRVAWCQLVDGVVSREAGLHSLECFLESICVLSLYHNCDSTTIRLRRKIDMFIFFARVEWKQARAIRRSRIVLESQL